MVERRDLPLFAWGDALRARRRRAALLRVRAALLAAGITCIGVTIAAPPAPRLVWNASASAPIGLYRVIPGDRPAAGDTVIAWLPTAPRALAARRHYLPANVPLVKRVVAGPGDSICARGPVITVNGYRMAIRRAADRAGRPMPWWSGCRTLHDRQLFLLMTASPDSFDGRYFGPSEARDLVGRATLLWAW
uniref:S26 family signal peptidase n=1 Tax=uncultured Sphingomonas sp. TaxID=158754 RepID=UPI0035CA176E